MKRRWPFVLLMLLSVAIWAVISFALFGGKK